MEPTFNFLFNPVTHDIACATDENNTVMSSAAPATHNIGIVVYFPSVRSSIEMSECQFKLADALSSKNIGLQPVGRFIPQCEKDGNYSRIQCWSSTGYCWCVDPKTGVEQELTRVRGKPNCAIKTHEINFGKNVSDFLSKCIRE